MPPPDQKKLELRLVVTADTLQGSAALQALAGQATRLDDAFQRANRSAAQAKQKSLAGGLLDQPALADRYNKSGFGKAIGTTGEFGALAARVAAPVAASAALVATAANLTHAIGQLDNQMLTGREKVLGFARAIPLIGGALAGLIDNAKDAIDRLADPELAARVDRGRIEEPVLLRQERARAESFRRGRGLAGEVRGAENRFAAVQKYPTLAYTEQRALEQPGILGAPAFGLGGVVGATAAIGLGGYLGLRDPRLVEGEEAIQAAKRAADFARREANSSASDVGHARRERDAATRAAGAATARTEAEERAAKALGVPGRSARQRAGDEQYRMTYDTYSGKSGARNLGAHALAQFGGAVAYTFPSITNAGGANGPQGNKFSYEDARRAETAALERQQRALADLEAKITDNKQKQLELLQRQQDVSRAEVNLQKTRLALVDEQIARVKGGTLGYAAMDKSGQSDLLDAARRFKDGGRENVSAEELSLLQGNPLTAGLVQERLERDLRDKKVSGVGDLLKLTGQRDLRDLEASRKKLEAKIALDVQLDEEQFARLTAEKLKSLNLKDLLGEIVAAQFKLEFRKAKLEADRGRLEGGGN